MKIKDEIIALDVEQILDDLVSQIPEHEPYAPEGEHTTLRDLFPNLTEEELDYVMSKYTGNIEKG